MADPYNYRADYRTQDGWHNIAFDRFTLKDGRVLTTMDDAGAEYVRRSLNESFNIGGANFHASEAAGFVLHVSRVRVYDQRTGALVGTAEAPMFEVV